MSPSVLPGPLIFTAAMAWTPAPPPAPILRDAAIPPCSQVAWIRRTTRTHSTPHRGIRFMTNRSARDMCTGATTTHGAAIRLSISTRPPTEPTAAAESAHRAAPTRR
eukprot:1784459-Prymnesium_polylepis.1